MTLAEFEQITASYPRLRIAVVGDFCLDRYLEIDPERAEVSIETGLPVHNVVRVRSQPGGAGTILNNLVALGIGQIRPIGFHGVDGEGYELRRAMASMDGVDLRGLLETADRRTFTYCKPLILHRGRPPEELHRLDTKNWTPTPHNVSRILSREILAVADHVDAFILLDQVDLAETGVITRILLDTLKDLAVARPEMPIIADSRRGLATFPPVVLKMNRQELAATTGTGFTLNVTAAAEAARTLALQRKKPVIVTLAEEGIIGSTPAGETIHVPCHPVQGPIDIVGAGDAVTANLTAALAGGAPLETALRLATAAASVVIHQLGTTGTANPGQLRTKLFP